ncbi:hypothetical protein SRHO_G00024270 [Serrasalmus rhombeus]
MEGYGLSEEDLFSSSLHNFTWENSFEQLRAYMTLSGFARRRLTGSFNSMLCSLELLQSNSKSEGEQNRLTRWICRLNNCPSSPALQKRCFQFVSTMRTSILYWVRSIIQSLRNGVRMKNRPQPFIKNYR